MATYKNIRVKKSNGGFRTQRAMVLANGRLKFVKNTTGGASAPRKARHVAKKRNRKSHSRAMARTTRRAPARRMMRRRRRSGGGGIGGMNLLHLGGATLGLAYLTSAKSPAPSVVEYANKIPGAKTFGPAATIGIACLAADRFVKPNRWLKLLGAAGIVLAASKVGSQGSSFKWVGDDDDIVADVGDDEIADYDDDDDDSDDE